MNQPSIRVQSFAKINWSLRVLGKRPDGYHEISTTLQTISLHDDLLFEQNVSGDIFLSCDEPDIPTSSDNLIVRAALTLKNRYAVDGGASIHLHKRIPTKAGLGGGSSNAAVTLLALNELWHIGAGIADLEVVAANIGADVPFFLHGGSAMATGIGTEITPLPDAGTAHLIVLQPRVTVSTAEAYKALNSPALTSNIPIPILAGSPRAGDFSESAPARGEDLQNDFELTIFDMEPEIKRAKSALLTAGAESALLAGSGSSVFGIFTDRETQQRALNQIQLEPGWRVFDCVTVSRLEYARALNL
ncbi:MAG TPA: 4-(cytidine 5'-diphospho)-2-C-methyl-D-erythritol kinase [Pyrinomonadaceae bacterium]|nr:4-(cytidine 5'-diphospho)-2-C-methyl-D-erythritol kinase [Pyrinomonadaceae bacterium]